MQAGKLRSRVTLQQLADGEDAIGQQVTNWVDVATLWADVRQQNGLEAIKAGAEMSIVRASIRIRYRSGINAGMRVVYGSVVYQIKAVLEDVAKKQHIDLVCEVVS